jgi:hypothetical protein
MKIHDMICLFVPTDNIENIFVLSKKYIRVKKTHRLALWDISTLKELSG